MATELKPLQEFFNKRVFRIPDYQRGFAWGISQLQDFWQDLNRIPEGRNHYTGQITLEAVPKDAWQKWDEDTWLITGSNYKPFYIVDGQQRLTTAVILLKCLIDVIPEGEALAFTPKAELVGNYLLRQAGVSRAYLFGYEKDNPSYEYLKTQVLGQPSNSFQGTETVYTANLSQARDFFKKRLEKLEVPQIDDLFRRLTQRFVFNEYELDADLDVFVAFETMNNRGKLLSKLELLKNRLIYLSTLTPVDPDQQLSLRRNINEAWKTIYEYLGKESGSPLDDDDFLRAHWIMTFSYAREEADQYAKFLLDQHFTPNRVTDKKLGAGEIQAFVNSIQNSVKAWHAIHFPHRAANVADEVRSGLERCSRVGGRAFEPLIMAALQKTESASVVAAFLDAAEKFVFVVGRLCQRKSNTGDSEFYRLAGQLHRGEKSLNEATTLVRERTQQYFSLVKAKLEMSELFDDNEGFYAWSGRYYFLFEYEQYLKTQAGMQAVKINWDEFTASKKDHVTVEHIYPRSPVAGEWPTIEARSEKERHILRHTLGNLLALSQSRNSKFSNRSFAVKKQDADGVRGYFNGSYSEIAVAQKPDWTPKEVLERGVEMLDFLENRWSISLGSRADKVELLNLEFLEPNPILAELTREP
jgi:uncharacterized protein with ParB-like and HNH nuclease domain